MIFVASRPLFQRGIATFCCIAILVCCFSSGSDAVQVVSQDTSEQSFPIINESVSSVVANKVVERQLAVPVSTPTTKRPRRTRRPTKKPTRKPRTRRPRTRKPSSEPSVEPSTELRSTCIEDGDPCIQYVTCETECCNGGDYGYDDIQMRTVCGTFLPVDVKSVCVNDPIPNGTIPFPNYKGPGFLIKNDTPWPLEISLWLVSIDFAQTIGLFLVVSFFGISHSALFCFVFEVSTTLLVTSSARSIFLFENWSFFIYCTS